MEIKTDKKEKISQERLEALAGLDGYAQSCIGYTKPEYKSTEEQYEKAKKELMAVVKVL